MRSDSAGASGPFKVFGTVGSSALSRSRRHRSSNAPSSRCRHSIASLSSTRRHICAFVPHTGARNSRNRFRMSSTGEELSKYSNDDPRRARAVSKLGVVGPELDGNSSGSPSTTSATKQVLHQHCELLQPSCKLWRPPRENFHNVQRHTAITFRQFAASWSCLEPVAMCDQLSHAGDRRSHVRDSELCTHTPTFRSDQVHSPRAMSFILCPCAS